jgi:hypothetical protein
MATLAAVWNRFFERGRAVEAPRLSGAAPLPAFANEDIYFFVKHIDNSGVVRADDPASGGVCWRTIGSAVGAVVLVIGVLLPSAYGLLAGYQIQSLRKEAQQLAAEQASLELQEAALVSPQRMEELAKMQQFVDPAPDKVVYLENNGSLALNNAAGALGAGASEGQTAKPAAANRK